MKSSNQESNSLTIDPRIEDTFAEAFEMRFCRLVITAIDKQWLSIAAGEFCGYGTSVIACDAEVGIEGWVDVTRTPDGREGISVLAFGFSSDSLAEAVVKRTGQCLMTCPTTAVFNGHQSDKMIPLGRSIRFFGDGYQKSKKLGDRRFWRVPVMDGEFVVEEMAGIGKGVGGGNFIIQSRDSTSGLSAASFAASAIAEIDGCITPFPGGIARSGSKVGSRYKNLIASTSESYCPSLRGRVDSKLHDEAICAYEIVIDAVDEPTVRRAMRTGIQALIASSGAGDIVRIGAGNYGGKLGKCLISLPSLFETG